MPDNLLWLIAFPFIFYASTAVHEIGHALGAYIADCRLTSISVGPLKIERRAHGVRFSYGLDLFGGLTTCSPRGTHNLRKRLLILSAAGPVANLLIATVATVMLAGSFLLGSAGGAATGILVEVIVCSLIMLVVSTALLHHPNQPLNDGETISLLRRPSPEAERHCALFSLKAADILGMRSRDLPPDLFQQATTGTDFSADTISASLLGYYRCLDRSDRDGAGLFLDRAVPRTGYGQREQRANVLFEAAYFLARHRNDAAAARARWMEVRDEPEPLLPRLRAEAAVRLSEGDEAGAMILVAQGLAVLRVHPPTGHAQIERDLFVGLLGTRTPQPSVIL